MRNFSDRRRFRSSCRRPETHTDDIFCIFNWDEIDASSCPNRASSEAREMHAGRSEWPLDGHISRARAPITGSRRFRNNAGADDMAFANFNTISAVSLEREWLRYRDIAARIRGNTVRTHTLQWAHDCTSRGYLVYMSAPRVIQT